MIFLFSVFLFVCIGNILFSLQPMMNCSSPHLPEPPPYMELPPGIPRPYHVEERSATIHPHDTTHMHYGQDFSFHGYPANPQCYTASVDGVNGSVQFCNDDTRLETLSYDANGNPSCQILNGGPQLNLTQADDISQLTYNEEIHQDVRDMIDACMSLMDRLHLLYQKVLQKRDRPRMNDDQ